VIIFIWILIFVFIIFAGFFAGSETVIVSCDKHLIKDKAKKGDNHSTKIIKLFSQPDKFLATTLVGTNICVVTVSILFKEEFHNLTSLEGISLASLTTVIVAFFMLIVSEIIPKTIGLVVSNRLAYISTKFINIAYYVLFPAIIFIKFISNLIEKILKVKLKEKSTSVFSHKAELKSFVMNTSFIKDVEGSYISNILNYSKTTAREIMTPLVDVISIEVNSSINDLIKIITNSNYSRIPVYKNRVDNIIGYINSLDLIYDVEETSIKEFIKEPYYIPETKKVGNILMDIQRKKIPFVIVVDEYGGASGIITDEDIAEEIVGDILFETEEKSIVLTNNGEQMVVDSYVDVDDLNEEFKLDIEKDGFETIGGFVMYCLGHIPKKGEHFDYKGYSYLVDSANERSIDKIIIKKIKNKD